MRYCRFQSESGPHYALVETRQGEEWIAAPMPAPEEDARAATPPNAFAPVPLASARLLAPVVPSKIVCVGRNYREHASELGNEVPAEPLIFLKPPSSILAPGDPIRHPKQSERVDYEGELGIVIGRRCSKLGRDTGDEEVRSYIRGYTIVNDVTARDLQKKDSQWTRAKGFDTFFPVGPVVTDEIDPFRGVELETRLNGERRQHASTHEFIFDIPAMIRYIADVMTLEPGDLIATGTPAGVAPMKPGDTVEVEIAGIGVLRNSVRD